MGVGWGGPAKTSAERWSHGGVYMCNSRDVGYFPKEEIIILKAPFLPPKTKYPKTLLAFKDESKIRAQLLGFHCLEGKVMPSTNLRVFRLFLIALALQAGGPF